MFKIRRFITLYFLLTPIILFFISYLLTRIGIKITSIPSYFKPIGLFLLFYFTLSAWVLFIKRDWLKSRIQTRPNLGPPSPEFRIYILGLCIFLMPSLVGQILFFFGSSLLELGILCFVSTLTIILWVRSAFPGNFWAS